MNQSARSSTRRPAPRRRRPRPAQPLKRDGTEERILDAAHDIFVRDGTSGARMQDIAKHAGVNQALVHYYFRHKERLSEAVFRRAAAELMPRVLGVMAADLALEEKVTQIVHLELEHLARAPYLPGYVISELHHHPERVEQLVSLLTSAAPEDLRPRAIAVLRRQILAGQRAGTVRKMPPDQFIVNLMALCIFPFAARPMISVLLGLDQAGFDSFIRDRRNQLVAFFLQAIRP